MEIDITFTRSITQEKAERFAIRIVKLYTYLVEEKNERVLSKQILRSGTSIGANISEAEVAFSKDDFQAKMYISYKECAETRYWINLLHRSELISDAMYQSLYNDCMELLRLLSSITKTIRIAKEEEKEKKRRASQP